MKVTFPFRGIVLITCLAVMIGVCDADTIIKKGNPNSKSLPVLMVDPSSTVSAGKSGLTGGAIGTPVPIIQSTSSGSTAIGATSLVLVSATNFPVPGTIWVPSQNAQITYSGVSGNTLTGIPANGAGSVTATIPTATLVTTGLVGSFTIKWTINSGSGQGFPALAAGSIIETANGLYEYIPTVAESNTTSDLHYIFQAVGAMDWEAVAVFQSYKVDDLGLALVPIIGTCTTGSTTTVVNSTLTAPRANSYTGEMLVFTGNTTSVLAGQLALVLSNTSGANSAITVMTATSVPAVSGDTFYLTTGPDIAAAVLNATAASYNTASSVGNKINNAGAAGNPLSTLMSTLTANDGTFGGTFKQIFPASAAPGTSGGVTIGGTAVTLPANGPVNFLANMQAPATFLLNTNAPSGFLNPGDVWGVSSVQLNNFGSLTAASNLIQAGRLIFDGNGNAKSNVFAVNSGVQAPAGFLTNEYSAIAGAVGTSTVDQLTLRQVLSLQQAMLIDADRTYNLSTHTATATWYASKTVSGSIVPDKTKTVLVKTTIYDSTDKQIISSSTVLTQANL